MKNKFLITFLLLSFTAFANAQNVPQGRPELYGSLKNVTCPIEVVPYQSIGPLRIGMTKNEVQALGMEMRGVQGIDGYFIVGMYTVQFLSDKLFLIEAELKDLPDCMSYQKTKIKKSFDEKKLAKIFPVCKEMEIRFGGNIIECSGVTISIGGWGGKQKSPMLKVLALEVPSVPVETAKILKELDDAYSELEKKAGNASGDYYASIKMAQQIRMTKKERIKARKLVNKMDEQTNATNQKKYRFYDYIKAVRLEVKDLNMVLLTPEMKTYHYKEEIRLYSDIINAGVKNTEKYFGEFSGSI
jgi:hypothetical protein